MKRAEAVRERLAFLEERVLYLEEANRTFVSILDMLASSEDFQSELSRGKTTEKIFETTMAQVRRLIPFRKMGFMENLEDASFSLVLCEPASCREGLQAEIDRMIREGNFCWALNRNQSVLVPASGEEGTLFLHVIATQARIRGMFIGTLPGGRRAIDSPTLNALTITLRTAAHALESCTLYAMLKEHLQNLERTVRERTEELERTALELKASNEKLTLLSDTDPLTHLFNRRFLMSKLQKEIELARENMEWLSIIILDIDRFKGINDTYGHQNGDVVLVAVGETARRAMRARDVVARYGGEEFLVVLPQTPPREALVVAERLRAAIEAIALHPPLSNLTITASLGVATLSPGAAGDINALIHQADAALYRAKGTGRNRVADMDPIAATVPWKGRESCGCERVAGES